MPAYVVANIDVHDKERYEEYKTMSAKSLKPFGGRFIVRAAPTQTLEGTWSPKRFVIIEFPSLELAHRWWNSDEYAPAKKLRQETSHADLIVVDGFAP